MTDFRSLSRRPLRWFWGWELEADVLPMEKKILRASAALLGRTATDEPKPPRFEEFELMSSGLQEGSLLSKLIARAEGTHMQRIATCLSAACLAIGVTIGSMTPLAQVHSLATAEAATLNGQHPAEYYRRAAKLFGEGRRDDAIFVFYLGQLRYRAHLSARRAELKPDGDPALFLSLSEVVGRPLNEWAFGDIPALVRTIDAVLAYDAANPDAFTPPVKHADTIRIVREGLSTMKATILRDAESIRKSRAKNGLENRN